MKKMLQRVFAVLMTLAIAITAIPMMEAKAAESKEVTLTYYWYDVDDGASYRQEKVIIEDGLTYGEFEKIYLPTPETDENFNFTGWESDYNPEDVVTATKLYYDATYDKYPVRVLRAYVDTNGEVKTEEFLGYYDVGTTFNEILPNYTVELDDMSTNHTFTKWNTSIYSAEEVSMNKTYCEIFADYETYNIVRLSYQYVQDNGEYGIPISEDVYVVVDKSLALGTDEARAALQEYFEENYAPQDHYNALGFTEWQWWNGANWDAEEENDVELALYLPIYSKAQIVLETEYESKVYAGEPGQTIQLPTEIDGQSVSWKCQEDGVVYEGSYTVPSDVGASKEITLRAMKEVTVHKKEYSETGEWVTSVETIIVDADASEKQIIALLSPGKDVAGLTFEGWEVTGYAEGDYPSVVKAIYNKNIINQYTYFLDEEGKIYSEEYTVVLDKDATYRDVLKELDAAENVMGCSFTGWKLDMEGISLDDAIVSPEISWAATYDKYPVTVEKIYIDNTGAVKVEETEKFYNAGTSMESIYNENKGTPTDALNSSVEWFDGYYEGEVSLFNNWLWYQAKYEDKVIVEFYNDYIADAGDHGEQKFEPVYAVLDNETCLSEEKLKAYFLNTVVPNADIKHFSKVPFVDWYFAEYIDTTGDGYINHLYIWSEYDTEDVIMVRGWVENADITYVWAAEAGQSITLPSNYNGYYLTWYDEKDNLVKDDVYIVPSEAVKGEFYYLEAKKDGKIPTQNDAIASFKDLNKILPFGTTITSLRLDTGSILFNHATELVKNEIENIENMAVFEIDMYDKDGVKLQQLNGKISLSVELPFEVTEGNILKVFRVEDETLVECPVLSFEKNFCTFETNHFSTYIFVEVKGVPATGDTTNVLPYMTLLLFGAGVFMVGNKKRNFI